MPDRQRPVAIVSDDYRRTEEALYRDPIIRGMAQDPVLATLSPRELEGHEFMVAALREYQAQGGTIGTHIGGPAAAIRRLLAETLPRTGNVEGDW